MNIYDYYDTDELGNLEYDLCGDEYLLLLRICFMYSTSVSFIICSSSVPELSSVHRDRGLVPLYVQKNYRNYSIQVSQIRHYRLTAQVQEAICKVTNSIFSWIDGWGHHNPEDLIFYRSDGSVFFSSTVHEGKCSLYVDENEDVSALISNEHWIQRNHN